MEKYIDSAVEQFRALITEQLARQNRMENDNFVKDFKNADKIIIGICGGDGIGPIITNGAQRVLEYLLSDEIKSGRVEMRSHRRAHDRKPSCMRQGDTRRCLSPNKSVRRYFEGADYNSEGRHYGECQRRHAP